MSHKVHPYGHRLGVIRDWKSRWFASRGKYQKFLKADVLAREWLEKRLRGMYVDSIDIERGANSLRITIKTSRPGMVIGRSGEGSNKIKSDLIIFFKKINSELPKDFKLDIEEVKNPESHAAIAAQMIAEGLEKRMPFKRVAKQTMEKVMAVRGVQGVRVGLSGRLGGAEMGRSENLKRGRLPLQTLRADVDFAREKAYLAYGVIGIKVWIYRGDIFAKDNK
jgi:small subunit ribosomal protein S3